MGKVGANKVIPGGERTLILRVLRFFEEEKRIGGPILPVNKVLKRTCAATGVSMATVTRIKREERKILEELAATQPVSKKEAASSPATTLSPTAALTTTMAGTTTVTPKNQASYSPRPVVTLPTPGRNRYRPAHNKVEVDDHTIGALRDIINRLHTNDEVPSLTKILAAAQDKLDFPGKRETLRKILKERLGYSGHAFKKCDKKHLFVDIVRPEIAALNSLVEIKAPEMQVSSVFVTTFKEEEQQSIKEEDEPSYAEEYPTSLKEEDP